MRYFARMNPLRAVRDLRAFLVSRQPYELWFMMASLAITAVVMLVFIKDSAVTREYRPDIIYVQQWPADRTDAQIRTQQLIDQVQRDKEDAELKRRQDRNRAAFKKMDDAMTRYGL